jgi:hypothetical protein
MSEPIWAKELSKSCYSGNWLYESSTSVIYLFSLLASTLLSSIIDPTSSDGSACPWIDCN